jgi:hypothetical protein
MHAEVMKLAMHSPHIIHVLLTKWHTQFQHILTVIPFLSLAILEL